MSTNPGTQREVVGVGVDWRDLSRDLTTCLQNRNRQLADCVEAIDTLIQTVEQLVPESSARGVANVVLFQGRTAIANAFEGRAMEAVAGVRNAAARKVSVHP